SAASALARSDWAVATFCWASSDDCRSLTHCCDDEVLCTVVLVVLDDDPPVCANDPFDADVFPQLELAALSAVRALDRALSTFCWPEATAWRAPVRASDVLDEVDAADERDEVCCTGVVT